MGKLAGDWEEFRLGIYLYLHLDSSSLNKLVLVKIRFSAETTMSLNTELCCHFLSINESINPCEYLFHICHFFHINSLVLNMSYVWFQLL